MSRKPERIETEAKPRIPDDASLSIAEKLVGHCNSRGLGVAVAESCSGGLLAATICMVPGASNCFQGGVVAYSNRMKERLLGVCPRLLAEHGAVSAPVAEAMALSVRRLGECDLGVATTGIAGPGGGSKEKPVGTVYIALVGDFGLISELCKFSGERRQVQAATVEKALSMVTIQLACQVTEQPGPRLR